MHFHIFRRNETTAHNPEGSPSFMRIEQESNTAYTGDIRNAHSGVSTDGQSGLSFSRRHALIWAAALVSIVVGLAGCGSGGGGSSSGTPVSVTGRVLRAETGLAPNPSATVTIGGTTVTTAVDGTFTFSAPSNATTAAITATGSQTRMITIALSSTQTNNLGDIYISDTGYTATVTGRVVASISGAIQPVGNATVTIANVSAVTKTDGTFSLAELPVDLGNVAGTVGKVTAAGFEDKPITDVNLQFPLKAGSNPIGDLLIAAPSGSTPLPPYTIKGVVQVSGQPKSGIGVKLTTTVNGTVTTLGTTTTDSTGTYTFWVTAGAYTVQATNTAATQSTLVTLVRLDQPVTAPTINF